MKKAFISVFLMLFLAFSVPVFADGDIPTGGKACTPTEQNPCPPRSGRQAINDEGKPINTNIDWVTFWLRYYLFR